MEKLTNKSFYYYTHLEGNKKYLDYLHAELDKRIYYYGNHFKSSYEGSLTISVYRRLFIELLLFAYSKIRYFKKAKGIKVLSNTYFGFKDELKNEGLYCIDVPWVFQTLPSVCSISDFIRIQKFKIKLRTSDFNFLISADMQAEIIKIENTLETLYDGSRIKAIFLSNDSNFFERITIDIAKRKGIKTFILMHGTAPRYINTFIDNRSDYLLIFGELFKKKFIDSGMSPNKLINIGHPIYSKKVHHSFNELRFDFYDILILSKTIPGQPLQIKTEVLDRSGDAMRVSDRGNSITYLLLLQQVLLKFGVKSVRLRLHPSESSKWYGKFIDTSFFQIDYEPNLVSLTKASLVIGPTSSTLFDALFCGVNYLIFEPLYGDGTDVLNKGIGHPFDNSDERIPAANSIERLEEILATKQRIDTSIIKEFINPKFSLQKVSEIVAS